MEMRCNTQMGSISTRKCTTRDEVRDGSGEAVQEAGGQCVRINNGH